MKKSFLTILFTLIFLGSFAQPPQSINYQGVARDSLGHPLLNRNVSLRLSILDSSATGQEIYSETHSTITSSSGLFNIYIGGGTVLSGNFELIPWGQGSKWLKVEMDVNGGSNYQMIGVSQFLSVPYSYHSNYANRSGNGMPDGVNIGDILYWNGLAWIKLSVGVNGNSLALCNGIPTWGGCPITINTDTISAVSYFSAFTGGMISNGNGTYIIAKGVCYSTSPNPTIDNNKTSDGNGIGNFSSIINGLTQNTTYFARAYATHTFGTAYGNQISFTTSSSFSVGDFYQGGKVAYILQPSDPGYNPNFPHGLIATTYDQGYHPWGCENLLISGADGTSIGTGRQNTIDIIAGCPTAGIAARICWDLIFNGYDDWFLPSRDELNKIYLNRNLIGGFTLDSYWNSTEVNSYQAYLNIFFNNTGSIINDNKNHSQLVRAVRYF